MNRRRFLGLLSLAPAIAILPPVATATVAPIPLNAVDCIFDGRSWYVSPHTIDYTGNSKVRAIL